MKKLFLMFVAIILFVANSSAQTVSMDVNKAANLEAIVALIMFVVALGGTALFGCLIALEDKKYFRWFIGISSCGCLILGLIISSLIHNAELSHSFLIVFYVLAGIILAGSSIIVHVVMYYEKMKTKKISKAYLNKEPAIMYISGHGEGRTAIF